MNLDTNTIPEELARRMIALGKVEWGTVPAKTDAEHIADFTNTLRITREDHGLTDEPRELHGVYIAGQGTVVCHTGTSPNSPAHAQIMAGLWNSVIDALMAPPAQQPALNAEQVQQLLVESHTLAERARERWEALEQIAVAEDWAPFVEAKHKAGECDEDEMRTSRATALTIARKIRQLQTQ